jgi:hypothetical protein
MAQFWIAVFFILLAIAQLCQSIKAIALPFPVYLVLGMVLAVAANSQSKFGFSPSQQVNLPELKTPDLLLAVTASPNTALAQPEAIEPKKPRTKAAPKSAILPATESVETLDSIELKQKRTRKTAAKSPQA